MQSGDFSTSADPPSLDLPSKSLTSAAKCRDRGSGEHFGLLLRSWRGKKEDVVWMQIAFPHTVIQPLAANAAALLPQTAKQLPQTANSCSASLQISFFLANFACAAARLNELRRAAALPLFPRAAALPLFPRAAALPLFPRAAASQHAVAR